MSTVTAFEIPLQPNPQSLSVSLVGVTYNLIIKWNEFEQTWVLDLYDQNQSLLVGGINMVTGTDLLAPYKYLKVGGQLVVQTDNNTLEPPTFTSLGITSHLYFLPD